MCLIAICDRCNGEFSGSEARYINMKSNSKHYCYHCDIAAIKEITGNKIKAF